MAYKSQVTNKYMGSTFKGAPRSNRNPQATELGQIVSVLKNDLTPAVANWAEANIEGQQDAAKKKIESMYTSGKSMADINKEILDGKHPDLEHKYTQAIVEGQIGRFEAYETINKITENIGDYKPREQTLETFWKGYLPNFDEKGTFYSDGFAAVFTEYKAKALEKDAVERATYQENQKINGIVNSLLTDYKQNGFQSGKSWQLIESFSSPLPFGGKKGNYFVNNAAKNKAMFLFVKGLINTATTIEQVEHAELLLDEARGGKFELGSLGETYNAEEVSKLRASIISQKDEINNREWNKYTREKILKETNYINDYFAYLVGGTLSDGSTIVRDGANPNQLADFDKQAADKLEEMLDYNQDLAASIVQIKSNRSQLDKDQDQLDFIMKSVQDGVYTENPSKLLADIAGAGGNSSDMVTFMAAWQNSKNRKENNLTLFPFDQDKFWENSKKFVWETLLVDNRLVKIENDEVKRRIIANTVLNEYSKQVSAWYNENPEPSKTLNDGRDWRDWNDNRKKFQFETESRLIATYKTEDYYKSIKALMDKGDTNAISKLIASEVEGQTIDTVFESQLMATENMLKEGGFSIQNIIEDAQNQLLSIGELGVIKERVASIKNELLKSGIKMSDEDITNKLLQGLGLKDTVIDIEGVKSQIQGNIESLINDGFIKTMPELINVEDKWWTPFTDEGVNTTPQVKEFLNSVLGELTGLGTELLVDGKPEILTRLAPTFIDLIAKGLNVDSEIFRQTIQKLYNITLPQG